MSQICPRLGGDGTKIALSGHVFDQPPGEMSTFRGKLSDRVGDHVALSPEGVVLVTYPGVESPYPRPPPIVKTLHSTPYHHPPSFDMT